MAKLTLDTITSSFASTTLFNTNFATILAELDGKVLYRNNTSGEANQMENDLDMNSNSILNANAINTTSLTVNGLPVAGGNVTAAAVTYDDSASVHTAVDVQEALDELGNASLATVQTSATDTTAGSLMAVGAFGIGSDVAPQLLDLKTLVSGGLYSVAGGSTNLPPNMSNGVAIVSKWLNGGTGESQSVIAHDLSNNAIWITSFDGYDQDTWSAWVPVYTGVNYQPQDLGGGLNVPQLMKNVSGTSWSNGTTKAGSGLEYTFAGSGGNLLGSGGAADGTWKNINNTNPANNQFVLAVKVAD